MRNAILNTNSFLVVPNVLKINSVLKIWWKIQKIFSNINRDEV
ncbi:hypothetical protein J2Z62_000454 [Mycoplasmoides fastidiosum]|uniref:Uncharacterized protein n=1 Tax=Mycoplasmoides fastidiosum TaxID=92758 RepID=A0ABU0LZ76_9BACT|nr:hypothetical protein [Mycoplasmoides fastidiosum]MDQ0514016.1 hypothetical protein [Mycoplasmoides fastidiosum]